MGQMYGNKFVAFLTESAIIQKDLFSRYDCSFLLKTKQLDSVRIRVAKDFKELSHNSFDEDSVYLSLSQMIALLFDIDKEKAALQKHEQTIGQIEEKVQQWRWFLKFVDEESSGSPVVDLILPKRKNDCEYMSRLMADVLNNLGVETSREFTPLWQDRPRSHYWCVAADSLGVLQPFTPPENNLREDWEGDLKYVGKVYRLANKPNKGSPAHLVRKGEYLPSVFYSDQLSDQTNLYHETSTIRIPLNRKSNNRLAYLCFYDNNEDKLSPVGWGKINRRRNSVLYKCVPHHVLLFPAIYEGSQLCPLGNPFIVENNGQLKWIEPQGAVDMALFRKYPEKRRLVKAAENLIGTCVLGGEEKKGPFDTLGRITQLPIPYPQDLVLTNDRPYRYYKIATKDRKPLNISEIQLLGVSQDSENTFKPMTLPIFSDDGTEADTLYAFNGQLLPTGNSIGDAVDGDVLSYTGSSDLIFYFASPTVVKVIRYLPRNANNIVVKNDEYVLYYYDKGWIEHGEVTASSNCIRFNDVPGNAVYLLSNLSNGIEELPFYYVNGKQVFINSP